MNYGMIRYLLGFIMGIEALAMVPPLLLSAWDGDRQVVVAFALTITLLLVGALLLLAKKPDRRGFFAKEGFVTVGLVWLVLSAFGALPFWISGQIPDYASCFFETVSGFTTTGASVLTDVEALARGLLLWRSITHFIGGLGVLVFVLAIVPMAENSGGNSLYLLRAESTGPQVGKLLPKMRDSAKVLYAIYIGMTLIMIVFLLLGRMPLFDSINTALGTAATGGFAIKNDSMAGYSGYLQGVTGVFMVLFGVNFNVYFFMLIREYKKALMNEELRVYLGVIVSAICLIAVNLVTVLGEGLGAAFGQAAFQVSSIITTTGYATVNFDLWPSFSKVVLLILMMLGACAGSTGGGIKIARSVILFKSAKNNLMRTLRPRQVSRVIMDGRAVEEETVYGVLGYMTLYAMIAIGSFLVISVDNFSVETNLSAVMATINNIGPGLGAVGPTASFGAYSAFSKIILSIDMLVGRLELFPMLLLLTTTVWKRGR